MSKRVFDIIITITNCCNLNCAYCINCCDSLENNYFISLEQLKENLQILKNSNLNLQRIILSGGDPFTHPLIENLCELTRYFFKTQDICIYTNGILLPKISDSKLINICKNNKISIISSLYPKIDYLSIYQTQIERFQKLNLELFFQASHFYFDKQSFTTNEINETTLNNFKKCRTLSKYNNLITIYKDKLFPCCGEIGMTRYSNNENFMPNLSNINKIDEFCEYPHETCKFCLSNANGDYILWQPTNHLTKKYLNTSLLDIYLNNYEDYYTLCHACDEHIKCFNHPLFQQYFNPEINFGDYMTTFTKFKTGYLDIYIPFQNKIDYNLLKSLLNKQTIIEKCNLYFININSNKDIVIDFYTNFKPNLENKLHTYFLKASSFYDGYKTFLKNSYLTNKLIFNLNNIEKLSNPNYLQEEYFKLQ